MRSSKSAKITTSLLGPLLVVFTMPLAQAQPRGGSQPAGPRYDPATEVTVTGTVEEVREIPHGARGPGIHLTLRTDRATYDVHVGPVRFLAEHAIAFAKGDPLRVTGSKVYYGGKDALLAREIKKGEKTVTLRDSRGIPEWSRGHRRSR
jgi:hypothetical protein